MGDRIAETVTLVGLARVERDSGDMISARKRLEQALTNIEANRSNVLSPSLRVAYVAASRGAYEMYAGVLARLDRFHPDPGLRALAFETSERSHARALLDAVNNYHSGPIPEDPRGATLNRIRAGLLDADSVLLEYLLRDDGSFLWSITNGTFRRFDLPSRRVLEPLVRQFYNALTARNLREAAESPEARRARIARADRQAHESAIKLKRLLLGPVLDNLANRRLILVADGILHYVPFAALGIESDIVYAPSASVLLAMSNERWRTPGAGSMLVLADPVFSADDPRVNRGSVKHGDEIPRRSTSDTGLAGLPRLRLSREEAHEISALAAGNVKEQLDFDAAPAALKASDLTKYRVIHIAAHALLNTRDPERSGVVLSMVDRNGAPRDGFLRLSQIYNLHLRADLVTLSACRTALGKEAAGEGLVGVSRGFLYAGARRVVGSLWNVEDRPTAEFMQRFYRNLFRNGLRPPGALSAAQKEMRQDPRWASPYYWAAFTLQGDWR